MIKDVNRFKMFPETLLAFRGHSMLVTDVFGHVGGRIEGLYHHGVRYLSRWTFTINGEEPRFVSANPVDTYSFTAYYLAPADGEAGKPAAALVTSEDREIAEKAIVIQVNRFIGDGMHQDMRLTNHALSAVEFELSWEVDADFADMSEALRGTRLQTAPIERRWAPTETGGDLHYTYGHPQLEHGLRLCFDAPQGPIHYRDGAVRYHLRLEPRQSLMFCVSAHPVFCGVEQDPTYDCESFHSHDTSWDHAWDDWTQHMARLSTPTHAVQDAWDRAVSDLGSLPLFDGDGARRFVPAAGVPMYQALFGRDSLTAAWQSAMLSPVMLRGALETIAERLGTHYDDRYDEQPGRVIHQHQLSPLPMLGLTPYLRYYGDYAGPGMFLIALAWYFFQTGDKAFYRGMRGAIRQVLHWIEKDADRDGDGFYEYDTRAGDWGTKNQGWKDSPEAIRYPDGSRVENPLAVVEVQGYIYEALQLSGLALLAAGELSWGIDLLGRAGELKARFNQAYWMPELGFYALALDAEHRPVGTIASNVGHALACGILDAEHVLPVAGSLMAPDMFSGWGIRTLSADHPAYNPFSYHLGSVWPSENATIALGFKRYGLTALVHDLAKGIFDATQLFQDSRLPEVLGGNPRDPAHPHPGIYPHACAPQAWSASAIVMLAQALLGLVPIAPLHTLVIDPDLPDWLPELTLGGVAVGEARVSLHFKRDASGHTDYRVLESAGRVRVLRQPVPDSLTAGARDRIGGLFESMLLH